MNDSLFARDPNETNSSLLRRNSGILYSALKDKNSYQPRILNSAKLSSKCEIKMNVK